MFSFFIFSQLLKCEFGSHWSVLTRME